MTERIRHFNSVSEFGDIHILIEEASISNKVEIELPASERDAFEAALEAHNKGIVENADVPALLDRLKDVASHHDHQPEDGAYSLIREPDDKPTFATFREMIDSAKNDGVFPDGNLTAMNLGMSDDADKAIDAASEYLAEQGYEGFSYLGGGTFTLAFRAQHPETGRNHVAKFSGWGGELQAKGNDIPDNIRPLNDNPDGMPDDWFMYVFPEVIALDKVADEIGPRTRIVVTYQEDGAEEDMKSEYYTIGQIDLVNAMTVNSISEGYFESDTVKGNVALLPDGTVKAYDMGMIGAIDNPTLNPYDSDRIEEQQKTFGSLGAPFDHVDHNGVSTDIIMFQPERYDEFVDHDPDFEMRAEL